MSEPISVPMGAPTASAMLLPLNTTAMALPTECAGTMRATYGAMLDHNIPCAMPPRSRAPPIAQPNVGAECEEYVAEANARTVAINKVLRGNPSSQEPGERKGGKDDDRSVDRSEITYGRFVHVEITADLGGSRPEGRSSVVTAVKPAAASTKRPPHGIFFGCCVSARDALDDGVPTTTGCCFKDCSSGMSLGGFRRGGPYNVMQPR